MFIKKKKRNNEPRKDHDVLITVIGECVRIRFRQGSYRVITNTGFMNIFLENNQIYFEESDENSFKVSVAKKNIQIDYGTVSCRNSKALKEWAVENRGRYDLTHKDNRFSITGKR